MPTVAEKYDLLSSQTYVGKDQSFARTVIGDEKQQEFLPQVKLERWDNEINFSLRLLHGESAPRVRSEDGKIKWVGEKLEAHFYDIDGLGEGGALEFEVICHERPANDRVEFTLQSKGVEFHYQHPLTVEQQLAGFQQPENIAGAYLVRHASKHGDYSQVGGRNYQLGFLGYLFRPWLEDSAGKRVWGALNIDPKAGILTISAAKEFWAGAVYPVRVDPTFGYTGHPATSAQINADQGGLGLFALSEAGDVTDLTIYGKSVSGTVNVKGVIYDDDGGGGEPATLMGVTNPAAISATLQEWELNFASPLSLSAASWWLGMIVEGAVYGYFETSGGSLRLGNNNYATPTNWTGNLASYSYTLAIYATYTASGGGGFHLLPIICGGN